MRQGVGAFIHHTNLEDAEADKRTLVCYDCGVACDLSQMRTERIDFLAKMGAHTQLAHRAPRGRRDSGRSAAKARLEASAPGNEPTDRDTAPLPFQVREDRADRAARSSRFDPRASAGDASHRGSDRLFAGFHPKPDLTFSPALSLGVLSLSEFVDMKLLCDLDPTAILEEMSAAASDGLVFSGGIKLGPEDPGITKIVTGARYLLAFARPVLAEHGGEAWLRDRVEAFLETTEHKVRREVDRLAKYVDVRSFVTGAAIGAESAAREVRLAGVLGDLVVLEVDVKILGSGGVKTVEIVEAITDDAGFPHRAIRAALYGERDGKHVDPLDTAAIRRPHAPTVETAVSAG